MLRTTDNLPDLCTAPIAALETTAESVISPHPERLSMWLRRIGDGQISGAQPVIDGAILALSFLMAYLARYDGLSREHLLQLALWGPLLVVVHLLLLRTLGVNRFLWRFICLSDTIAIARSLFWVTAALVALRWLYPVNAPEAYWLRLPMGIIVPEFCLSLCGVVAVRSICRMAQQRSDRSAMRTGQRRKRLLLYGAGRAGIMLAHELASHGGLEVTGFIDDDPRKMGTVIAGLPVLGSGSALETLVRRTEADEVLITIAGATPRVLTRIVARCRAVPIKTRIVPPVEEIVAGRVNISHVREIHIEELRGRNTVAGDDFDLYVRNAYAGKRILVTGAGGSIGSELCRRVLLLKPSRLAILDKDENSIYDLENELRMRYPEADVEPLIADTKMRERITTVLADFRPQVVLHAAAHKHVPLMEKNPCEAVLNNIMGLKHVIEACHMANVERFIFISSDKAVNPTNVMGATKRAGEKLLAVGTAGRSMRAAAVRFGNVMGSRGSVIPLFQRQIEKGGPVTVTHPDMMRFFMTIPEAVQLVLCAGSLARYSETFVLDMGNPRRVIDLARQMIELSGLEPGKDIEISITGLRPGEKMEEELAAPGESLYGTRMDKVLEISPTSFDKAAFQRDVEVLIEVARSGDSQGVIECLAAMDLGYQPPAAFPAPAAAEICAAALAS
jgi:FlaA1/EpsC-like NDP-sugar epimerase